MDNTNNDALNDTSHHDILIVFSDILENIEDLCPEFSAVVDEHFWELI